MAAALLAFPRERSLVTFPAALLLGELLLYAQPLLQPSDEFPPGRVHCTEKHADQVVRVYVQTPNIVRY